MKIIPLRKPHWAKLCLVLCALRDWPAATEQLELFLASAPSTYLIASALDELTDLAATFPMDTDELEPIRRRLESAREE